MIIGIDCRRCGRIPFSEIEREHCLPQPILRALIQYPRRYQPNRFSIGELSNDLGYAYADRTTETYATLETLWTIQRGRGFHKDLLEKFQFHETEGSMNFAVGGTTFYVNGRLDGYEPENGTITEIKTIGDVSHLSHPRMKDQLQLQCYGTLFKPILMRISGLQLMYIDMNGWRTFQVDLSDKPEFIKGRVSVLYEALTARIPPREPLFRPATIRDSPSPTYHNGSS